MNVIVPSVTDRVALHRLLMDMLAICADDLAHRRQLDRALEGPIRRRLLIARRPRRHRPWQILYRRALGR
jgi:hypothetical protein